MNVVPFSYNSKEVRVIQDENGEYWWVAKDVCAILGLKNVTKALVELDPDEKTTLTKSKAGNDISKLRAINEPGLYSLIIRSNKPEAKKFKRWITHEVLPKIRKTGTYSTSVAKPDFDKQAIKQEAEETRLTTSVFKANLSLAKAVGLKGNQAILFANDKTKEITHRDCLEITGTSHLICEKQELHLTATDLGKPHGLSGQKVNKILEAQGIIESRRDHKDRLLWIPTEKGRDYTVLKDTGKSHGDGTPVQQLMYLESAEQFLAEEPLLTATA